MKQDIYQLALRCKNISDERIGTDRNLIPYRNILFTDYTVKGNVDEYREAIRDLQLAIADKYSAISNELKLHNDEYGNSDKIVHFTAMRTIVDCVLSLETRKNAKRIFISHSSQDETIVKGFIKDILMAGCGFRRTDIFCTLDHTAIRTGDDFRNEIVENMKKCDFILCMISDNYRKSEVCQNELGAAWAMEGKRVLPFKFPNLGFSEIGFLNVVKQAADITDKSKLDELYDELCQRYDLPQDWRNYNMLKDEFVELVNKTESI